jgi:hypothetical protein
MLNLAFLVFLVVPQVYRRVIFLSAIVSEDTRADSSASPSSVASLDPSVAPSTC